ncbi:hypothetical protein J6590_012741 [Homalodisca vitripennis]|nr:hypothetical protein J6590_012741 [Homalodisca vitripennis]
MADPVPPTNQWDDVDLDINPDEGSLIINKVSQKVELATLNCIPQIAGKLGSVINPNVYGLLVLYGCSIVITEVSGR